MDNQLILPSKKQSTTVKVAAIQCHLSMTEVSHNITKMSVLCEEAATAGAKIIVFPELSVNGFLMNSDKTKHWKASNRAVSNRIEYVLLFCDHIHTHQLIFFVTSSFFFIHAQFFVILSQPLTFFPQL